jgi:hypothetical protein
MKAIAIALIAGVASCQNSSDWKSVRISVNETAIEDVYRDAFELNQLYQNAVRAEKQEVRKALADAYKNTAGKLILNFGKTVTPAVQAWAELASNAQVNAQCNQDCAVQCFDPKTFGFTDMNCVRQCGCTFQFETAPQGQVD